MQHFSTQPSWGFFSAAKWYFIVFIYRILETHAPLTAATWRCVHTASERSCSEGRMLGPGQTQSVTQRQRRRVCQRVGGRGVGVDRVSRGSVSEWFRQSCSTLNPGSCLSVRHSRPSFAQGCLKTALASSQASFCYFVNVTLNLWYHSSFFFFWMILWTQIPRSEWLGQKASLSFWLLLSRT